MSNLTFLRVRSVCIHDRDKILWSLAVIGLYLTSSTIWALIETSKLLSYSAFVYDLGVNVGSLNSIAHTLSLKQLLELVPASKPFVLVLAPITYLYSGPIIFLYIQSFGVLLASPFIYLLSIRKGFPYYLSFLLSLAFVIFFPLSWYLYFDLHIAGFFSTFFFAGMYIEARRPRLSAVLYLLAASTSLVLSLFLFVYLLVKFLVKVNKKPVIWKNSKLMLNSVCGLVAPLPIIIFAYYHYQFVGLVTFGGAQSGLSTGNVLSRYAENLSIAFQSGFLILFLMSVLFLIILVLVLRKANFLYVIPTAIVIFFVLFGGYHFWNMKVQYSGEYFTPVLFFLILVDSDIEGEKAPPVAANHTHVMKKITERGVLLFILLVLFMGVFYNPYGPLNSPSLPGNNAYADFHSQTNVSVQDRVSSKFVSLVPYNSTILLQDNEPQYSNRPRNYMFGPGNLPWLNSTFFYNAGPKPKSTIPDYIAVDVNQAVLDKGWMYFPFYNSTSGNMYSWFNYFYSNYNYGLVGFAYPYYLYELNYTGPPSIISELNLLGSPYVAGMSTGTLIHQFNSTNSVKTTDFALNQIFFLPTTYTIKFSFTAFNLIGNISFFVRNSQVSVSSNYHVNVSGESEITCNLSFQVSNQGVYSVGVNGSGLKGEIVSYDSELLDFNYALQKSIEQRLLNSIKLKISNSAPLSTGTYDQFVRLSGTDLNFLNNSAYSNIEFYYQNGESIPSWLQSFNSTGATWWLRTSNIPAGGFKIIDLFVGPKNQDYLDGYFVGEAPCLSTIYAEYDNGAFVFGSPTGNSGYFNFIDGSLNTNLRVIAGGYGYSSGSYVVNNGLTLVGFNQRAAFEAIGTSASISNSALISWGLSSPLHSANGTSLNNPALGGWANQILVGNRSNGVVISIANNSSDRSNHYLNRNLIGNLNYFILSYGTGKSLYANVNGASFRTNLPDYEFHNYVGATFAYVGNQKFPLSPTLYYIFIINTPYDNVEPNVNVFS